MIHNRSGTIGGTASIMFNVGGNVTSATDAFFRIDNSNGGTIALSPSISVHANNIMTAVSLYGFIDNSIANGVPIGTPRTTTIQANGTITAGQNIVVLGDVIAGGNITANGLFSPTS